MLSSLSSLKGNQCFKFLLELPSCTLSLQSYLLCWPLHMYFRFEMSQGHLFCLSGNLRAEVGTLVNLMIKLISVAPFQTPLPIHGVGFTAQGCMLIWAHRNASARPITGVCVSPQSSAFVNSSCVFFKNTGHIVVSSWSCLSGGTRCVVCNSFLLYLMVLGPSFELWLLQDCWPQLF